MDHVNTEQLSLHLFCQWVWYWQSGGGRKVVAVVSYIVLTGSMKRLMEEFAL